MIYSTVAAFVIALALGFAIIPVFKRMASKWGLVDHPDQKRKLHKDATPLIGGIAIFVSTLLALAIVVAVFYRQISQLDMDFMKLGGLLLTSGLILLIGVVDDRFMMRGRQKLLGQIAAATVLILFGFRFDSIHVMGHTLDLQVFSIVVVYGWILIGVNSVNLLDGADGFATTIGVLMSGALCVMAFHLEKYDDAIICAAMAGSLLAFMRFNFPPASAYLGDAGSMLVGLFIAAMAIKCSSKEAAAYAFLAPIALLAIPMFDTMAAIVRRRLTGRSIYAVDRGHLHHALMRKGFGPRKALLLFFGMCLMTATGGIMSLVYRQSEYAILSIMAVVIFLMVGRVFGFAEYKLITNRSKSLFRSFLSPPKTKDSQASSGHHASVRLQGERNWDLCWQVIREFAENNRLLRTTMDLNLPWIHESFHATYTCNDHKRPADEIWTVELPLVIEDRIIGRINLQGSAQESDFGVTMGRLVSILDSLQEFFVETIESSLNSRHQDDADHAARQSLEFGKARVLANGDLDSDPSDQKILDVG